MKLTALSRTVVRKDHALITGDGFVNSTVPGWTNCIVNVVINEAMGARFAQLLTSMEQASKLEGKTKESQIFFYLIQGSCELQLENSSYSLEEGSYAYIPINRKYLFSGAIPGTQLLSFHKVYESLDDFKIPDPLIGQSKKISQNIYAGDESLLMQNLLPDAQNLAFDMAVNIFTYLPGANLPFVETHIMEHGLLYLQGQGVYRLAEEWYPVKKGDAIWMAPYCPQWFVAMGKEPAIYIYYKNVNRFPAKV